MVDDNVNLTYEALFELVMREKNRAELQVLHPAFYADFVLYLKKKKEMLHESIPLETLYQDTHVERLSKQVRNIKSLIRELYERREKKIIIMAMNQVRIDEEVIDKILFLPEELNFFNGLCEIFKHYKFEILYSLLQGKEPNILNNALTIGKSENSHVNEMLNKTLLSNDLQKKNQNSSVNKESYNNMVHIDSEKTEIEMKRSISNLMGSNLMESNSSDNPLQNGLQTKQQKNSEEQWQNSDEEQQNIDMEQNSTVKQNNAFIDSDITDKSIPLLIKDSVEPFLGENLEIYGPYKEGDRVNLPENLAGILINDKKAELV